MTRPWWPVWAKLPRGSVEPKDPVGAQSLALLQQANRLKDKDPERAIILYREITRRFRDSPRNWSRQHARTALFQTKSLLVALGRHDEVAALADAELRQAEENGDVDRACSLLYDRAQLLFGAGSYADAAALCRAVRAKALGVDHTWWRELRLFESSRGEVEALAALGRIDEAVAVAEEVVAEASWPPPPWTLWLRLRLATALRTAGRTAEVMAICHDVVAAYEAAAGATDPHGYNTAYEFQEPAAAAMILKADVLAELGRTEEALRLYARTAASFVYAYEERDSEDMAARSQALNATLQQGRLLRSLGRADESVDAFRTVVTIAGNWPSLQKFADAARKELR